MVLRYYMFHEHYYRRFRIHAIYRSWCSASLYCNIVRWVICSHLYPICSQRRRVSDGWNLFYRHKFGQWHQRVLC